MQSSPDNLAPDIADPAYDWRTLPFHQNAPSGSVRAWLQDERSLTRQLIALSGDQFAVKLVAEAWITLSAVELASHFGPVAPGHRFWSRKVQLWGKGQLWVAAHTLIPEHSFLSPLKQVIQLNTRPLGEFLFSHPDLLRSEMDFTPSADNGWGRRSLFFLFQKPVMVAEFFLPELISTIEKA